ncbi:DUF3108 domain-containing protein [Oxalicibacterium solurbis]|uniref:DUF3108 domain-containing protein n=1 Tax=Oxalicibacterium solurbis TaxID=69280 RepID=UPI001669CC92|nr:DUF3108 domain-containing protein [Oxalicibacterium solurbis]
MTRPAPSTDTRRSLRWLFVLVFSLLLHLLVIGHASEWIRLPSPSTVEDDVIDAELIAPPPAPVPKPKPKPKPRPKPHPAPAKPAPPPSATASAEQPADVQTAAISQPDAQGAATGPTADIAEPVEPDYTIDLPPSAKLEYDVQKTPIEGQPTYGSGTIAWHQDGSRYTIDGDFGVLFITALHFHSEGTIESDGIAPELYSEKRFRRAETNAYFYRESNTIGFSTSSKSYPRTGTEQDRASIIWQLAGIGRGDETRYAPGAVFDVIVTGTRDAEPWQIQVIGREDIDFDGNTISAWHVVRAPRARSRDQRLDIWLAPQIQWYPVRLRYTEPNGDVLNMTLSDLNVSAVP